MADGCRDPAGSIEFVYGPVKRITERSMTVANSNDGVYIVVKDTHGEELLCPVDRIQNRNALTENELLNCFEKDVAERYSGNIKIKS
jgi:hypothetical protein